MSQRSPRVSFINFLATLCYISIMFQWLWAVAILAYPFLSSDMSFLLPVNEARPHPVASTIPLSPFTIGFVIVLTVIVFGFTCYVLWKLPKTIGRRGGQATKRMAQAIVPVITHHHATSKKQRRVLSRKLVISIKFALIVIPLAALVFAHSIGTLEIGVIWVVGLFCAAWSLVYIGLQQLFVKFWRIPFEQVW